MQPRARNGPSIAYVATAPADGPAPAGVPTLESAWGIYRRKQVQQFPVQFRTLLIVGTILIGAFAVVDLHYPWPVALRLGPWTLVTWRVPWIGFYLALLATSYYRADDPRMQIARDVTVCAVTSLLLGILCAKTGRVNSPYYPGLALMFAARLTVVRTPVVQTLAMCLLVLGTWLLGACLWPAPAPMPAFDGWRGVTVLLLMSTLPVSSLWAEWRAERLALHLEEVELRDRYRLIRPLGSGGMGDVFLAMHASLRRLCAVKIMREHLDDPVAVGRFEREAAAASRLRHPSAIAIYDYGVTAQGQPYYVMEYLEGHDLQRLVRDGGPLPPMRTAQLLGQAAGSLAEAHGLGMVHRDVKPANLFVTSAGPDSDLLKVLDFGLVKWSGLDGPLTREGSLMGTPAYIAPEALAGREVDCRADVYALGAVGYFLLTGGRPFASPDARAEILRQLHEPPPPLVVPPERPQPSAELRRIILRCLATDPADRYADGAAVATALGATPEARGPARRDPSTR